MSTYDRNLPMTERPLAFTDIETTGLSVARHEIIEIATVLTTPELETIDEFEVKIHPEHIETADEIALKVNGYTPEKWLGAISLSEAMGRFSNLTVNAMFVAHNVSFDWKFIERAFETTGVEDKLDYHRPDNFSIAWHALRGSGLAKFNQNELAKYFGLEPEPEEHRAINGARLVRDIYGKLMAA